MASSCQTPTSKKVSKTHAPADQTTKGLPSIRVWSPLFVGHEPLAKLRKYVIVFPSRGLPLSPRRANYPGRRSPPVASPGPRSLNNLYLFAKHRTTHTGSGFFIPSSPSVCQQTLTGRQKTMYISLTSQPTRQEGRWTRKINSF